MIRGASLMTLLMTLLAAAAVGGCGDDPGGRAVAPPPGDTRGFVGSAKCAACHADNFDSWHTTAHAYALREPVADVVVAAFDGVPVESRDFTATPYRLVDDYYIRVDGRNGFASGDHRVARVVGRAVEQSFLTEDEQGAWRVLPLCWSLERGEWDLTHEVLADIAGHEAAGDSPADRTLDSRQVVFNHGCAQCHATGFDPGVNGSRMDSTLVEGAVACESCHGPGAAHVVWHEAPEGTEREGPYAAPARLLHPEQDLSPREATESCGRCHYLHEWRYAIPDDPRVSHHDLGLSLHWDGSGFHADGRIAGLSYHGTTQSGSPCYVEGQMSCLHCHDLHGGRKFALRWDETSDEQCGACHAELVADPKPHTHHEEVRCVDCHMGKFVQGVLHFMRDHAITVPEPELTVRYGEANAPNACTPCHADQDAAWAQRARDEWWGPAPRQLVEDVGVVVALRQTPFGAPGEVLAEMAADTARRPFFRMTALRNLEFQGVGNHAPVLAGLLRDPLPEVRQLAVGIAGRHPRRAFVAPLGELLADDVRTVRVEALFALARAGWRADEAGDSEVVRRVWKDVLEMQQRRPRDEAVLAITVVIADALDETAAMERAWTDWRAVTPWLARRWTSESGEVVLRRARRGLEAGGFDQAEALLRTARERLGDSVSFLALLDEAEALEGLGRTAEAAALLEQAAARARGDLERALVAQRRGEVARDVARTLERVGSSPGAHPASGEVRRRLRR